MAVCISSSSAMRFTRWIHGVSSFTVTGKSSHLTRLHSYAPLRRDAGGVRATLRRSIRPDGRSRPSIAPSEGDTQSLEGVFGADTRVIWPFIALTAIVIVELPVLLLIVVVVWLPILVQWTEQRLGSAVCTSARAIPAVTAVSSISSIISAWFSTIIARIIPAIPVTTIIVIVIPAILVTTVVVAAFPAIPVLGGGLALLCVVGGCLGIWP